MEGRKEPSQTQIPKFKTEAEAAEFWDTHSPLDYPDQFQEVEAKFARPLIKRGLTIKLDGETIQELSQIAQEQGIGPTTLARMWILEHLRNRKSQQNR